MTDAKDWLQTGAPRYLEVASMLGNSASRCPSDFTSVLDILEWYPDAKKATKKGSETAVRAAILAEEQADE